jgi:hypothetical protein
MEEQFRVETLPKTIPISILLRMLRRGAKKLPPINRQKSSSIHAITEMAPTEQSRAENLGDVTPVHVLVVEDNKTNQKVMQLMMDKVGAVTYQMAENGQEAIDRFLENPKGFDCILMDCQVCYLSIFIHEIDMRRETERVVDASDGRSDGDPTDTKDRSGTT